MIEIIPAVLPKSLGELEEGLQKLRGLTTFVQVDLVGSNWLAGQESLPFWDEFDFEADIMLTNPMQEVQACVDAGASRIVVHASAPTARDAVELLQPYRTGDYPVAIGVALSSTDEPTALMPFDAKYDYVQVMGIAHIGKQGEPFDERVLTTVAALRAAHPELTIQVDGAAATHPRELVEAGASRLIVGSAIINADNPKEVLKSLYNKANGS